MVSKLVDSKKFDEMKSELDKFDVQIEKVISTSRDIIKVSKLIIYAVQRDSFNRLFQVCIKLVMFQPIVQEKCKKIFKCLN